MSVFKALQPLIFTFFSFPLDRSGGLGGDIVHDAVYAGDLVYDTAGGLVEDVIRDARPVSGHILLW